MLIRVGYRVEVELAAPAPVVTLLDIHPVRTSDVVLDIGWDNSRSPVKTFMDGFSNVTRTFAAPAGVLQLQRSAIVRDTGAYESFDTAAEQYAVNDLPAEALQFLKPSRYCESDRLQDFAWQRFASANGGYARVQAICDFVHKHIRFDYAAARSSRTASQAFDEQVGVCRDFAHLAVALCRAINIPARYTTGYLGDIGVPADPAPMDFSAWFEAYIGGKWVTFDARHNTPRIGRVIIAHGRDAADVPMVTTFGLHTLRRFEVVTEECDEHDIVAQADILLAA